MNVYTFREIGFIIQYNMHADTHGRSSVDDIMK